MIITACKVKSARCLFYENQKTIDKSMQTAYHVYSTQFVYSNITGVSLWK